MTMTREDEQRIYDQPAMRLSEMLFEVMEAKERLEKAHDSVPNYTGQHPNQFYYQNELLEYENVSKQFWYMVMEIARQASKPLTATTPPFTL